MLSLATKGLASVYFMHEAFQMTVEEMAEWEWGSWGNNDAVDLMGFFSSSDLVRRSSRVRRSVSKRGSVRRQTVALLK